MSWGFIAAAAITAGGAYLGGKQAASGANDAAGIQANASLESARILDETQRRFEARMQPYIQSGYTADRYINALLGLPAPSAPNAAQQYGGMIPGEPDWLGYFNAAPNADLRAEWARINQKGKHGFANAAEYAQWHYMNHGRFENRQLPVVGGAELNQQPVGDTSQADYDAAMSAYENSPWAKFARESSEKAREDANERFMSFSGARGSLVSGKTASGLYDIAQDAEDERFRSGFLEGWYPSITGVSTRGYNASVGVGDSSLETAAQVGAAGERAAQARADGARSANDAMANGVNSALYYAGQAWDAWQNRPQPEPSPKSPPTKTGSSSKYYGG